MCPRRLLPFSVTRGLEYSTETVAGPICWVTVACWLSPLGGRDSLSARATLENNAHVQRKVLFMASGTTPYASHRINARIPKWDGRQNRRDRVEPARTSPPGGRPFSGSAARGTASALHPRLGLVQRSSPPRSWPREPAARSRGAGPSVGGNMIGLALSSCAAANRIRGIMPGATPIETRIERRG